MLKVFCSPSRYVQGIDAMHRLAGEMIRIGHSGHALIIAGPHARRLVEPIVAASFGARGMSYAFTDFGGECSAAEITRCGAEGARIEAKVIIGIGGGKALDTARAVASDLALPVVCCPTVAASDAPCSALSVIYSSEGVFEQVRFYRRNPDLILVDTAIIARAPVRFLISGMGDALATWFEADAAQRACRLNAVGGFSTLAAMAIARTCYETLLRDGRAAVAAVHEGVVTPAVERIIETNTLLSGLGFESGGLAAAHSVHNGLTAMPVTRAYLHGEKVAFGTLVQMVLEGRPTSEIDEVMAFCASVGLPLTLAQLGIEKLSADEAKQIAERAIAPGETAHNLPFELTWTAVRDALIAADALGRNFLSEAR